MKAAGNYIGGKGMGRNYRKARKAAARRSGGFQLEMCSAKLLHATASDPFSTISDVCIPYGSSRPSQKIHSKLRATGFIGTQGVGFVCLSPTFITDFPSIFYTNASFATSAISVTATGVVQAVNPTGYASSYFDVPGIVNQGRVVSAAVRVRYTGTELNMSGQSYSLYTPDRTDLTGFTVGTFGTYEETEIKPFGREWITLSSVAQEDREWDYTSQDGVSSVLTYTFNTTTSAIAGVGRPVMAILVTGVAGQSFALEVIIRSEVIGENVQGLTSKNTVDIDGLSKVVSVVNKIPAKLASGIARTLAVTGAIAEVAASVSTAVDVFTGLAMAAAAA